MVIRVAVLHTREMHHEGNLQNSQAVELVEGCREVSLKPIVREVAAWTFRGNGGADTESNGK